MPNIDLRAIILLVGIMGLLMAVIIFFLRHTLPPSIEGLREWAAAPAVVFMSTVLLAMRGSIPDFFSVLCGNLLLLFGCQLFHTGAQRFFGMPPMKRALAWSIVILSVSAVAWTSLIAPDYGLRLRVMTVLMFGIFASLTLLVHKQAGATFSGRLTTLVLFVQSAVIFLRFVATFVWPSGTGLFEPFIYQTLYIASFTFTMLLLAVGTVLLANERMRVEFQSVIAESKQAAAEILGTRNQLQATLDAIPDLMFEVGLDGRYYDYHSPRTDLLAAAPEILLTKTVSEVLPAEAADVCLAALKEASDKGLSSGRQFALPLPQGVRWFEISVARREVATGQEPRFIVLSRDITERKSAELAQLESESRFRTIIEATPVPLALNDDKGNITYLNRAFVQTIGYTTSDIPTIADWWPRAYPDAQYRQWIVEKWQKESEEAKRQNTAFTPLEAAVGCKDGSVRTFMISATPLTENSAGNHLVVLYDITERKTAEEAIRNLAFYDALTGLPNRRLLLDRLKQALAASSRNGSFGAVLFIDLDNFKNLNDTRGHGVGDLLLQQVAQRLSICMREGDTVARLGGDEFVVMLEDLGGNSRDAAAQAKTVAEKILFTLNQAYQFAGFDYHSTPSIGITLFADHQGALDDLLRRADLAMYQAKAAGRNTLRFFDPEMQAVVTSRAEMEAGLREGMRKEQFLIYYQAQVDAKGCLTGSEALVRWQHPLRGMVSPAEFIPLAEETRLILPLGHWVLQAACTQLALWATRPKLAHLTVAVNVSAHQFRQSNFVDQVLAVLKNTGANPQRLKLELTESLLVSDVEDVIEKMVALKAEGVGFSLDDFGTGYSSLSYLKRLPLDQLKIDQSFVRDVLVDPNDASIARTIIALAQNLGLGVIAEGVETEAQHDFLARSGCHAYQGYFISRPLPIDGFEQFAQRV